MILSWLNSDEHFTKQVTIYNLTCPLMLSLNASHVNLGFGSRDTCYYVVTKSCPKLRGENGKQSADYCQGPQHLFTTILYSFYVISSFTITIGDLWFKSVVSIC